MRDPVALSITDASQVGEARRVATAMANALDFNETQRGKVGIVVTEAAGNLIKHATNGGELILRSLVSNGLHGLEILALDKGPGMANVSQCLEDGFSTVGTLGGGLGAIRRLSTLFDIHSVPQSGTALLARLWAKPLPVETLETPNLASLLEIGIVCLPKLGEEVSGDAWAVHQSFGRSLILVADGLGHGPAAAEASSAAVRIFEENTHLKPKEIIEAAHAALRSTRGAVVAVAELDLEQQTVCFAGVGNIAGAIVSERERRSMISYNGTVGHQVRKIQEFVYSWSKGALLVMHSDGLATQWHIDRYASLAEKHPSLVAGVLYRDFKRSRDDVTVLVAKECLPA